MDEFGLKTEMARDRAVWKRGIGPRATLAQRDKLEADDDDESSEQMT